MNSYTAFVYGGIKTRSDDAQADGSELARQCLENLKSAGDAEQFPPQLLILLASPAYLDLEDAKQLLEGIRGAFTAAEHGDVKLMGTSVAAVFFEHEIHAEGALLVCLASRLLYVRTGVGEGASSDPEGAVASLLGELKLDDHRKDLNPMSNRMLLTFFPDIGRGGSGSLAHASDELHRLIWTSTLCRIPIAGGVSSGYPRYGRGQGLQFCGWDVYTDAVVAAQVDSGAPLGVSLCRGLEPLRDERHDIVRLRVKSLSEDGAFIEGLEDLRGAEWKGNGDYLLLSEDTDERDFIIGRPEPQHGGRFLITDRVSVGDTLQLRRPYPEMLLNIAAGIVEQANKRVHVKHPLACLSLICSSHLRNHREMGIDIKQAIANIEREFHICVGGFVDGEAGVDHTGRSQFGNWSMVGIGFGDEMRDRTPLHRGFQALSAYSPQLTESTRLDEAISRSLRLVFDTGFPGAMISFPFLDQSQSAIIGMGAIGSRFGEIVGKTRRPLGGGDALAKAIRDRAARFIADTRTEPDCDPAEKAVLVSQYIFPLRGPGDDIIAVLQIDLGKTDKLSPLQQEILDSLGAAVGAGINRILNWQIVETTRQLDQALKASLSAETLREGLQSFIEATTRIFGASMGHVRLANLKDRYLSLVAGVGDYYEAATLCRSEIGFDDVSPTCEAYRKGKVIIINDARNNPAHAELRRRCRGSWLEGPLAKVGSYANRAFRGQREESIGTINLVSEKPWFFTWQHQHSLDALGERVGFLVEHLEQKEKRAALNKRLDFRLKASPQLNRVENFDDIQAALRDATNRFRDAAHADVASLYIWDVQSSRFILRVESGWEEPAWVNTARYQMGEGWIGRLQAEPMHAYNLSAEDEHYARQMFGAELADESAISAMGLPLTVRGKCLGVLALYRRERPGDVEGFRNTDFSDLQESANSMAALLSILLSWQETLFSDKLQTDLREIANIFLQDESLDALEKSLCEKIVEMFGAASADFYFYENATSRTSVTRFSPLGAWNARARQGPDHLIKKVKAGDSPEVVLREVPEEERAYPALASAEGRVMRCCFPIFVEGKTAGVIDVRWSDEQLRSGWQPAWHSKPQLRILGTVIGSAYNRYMLAGEKEAERRSKEQERRDKEAKQRGLQAMNALQLQSAHHFKNLLTALGYMPRLIRAAPSKGNWGELARDLTERLEKGHTYIVRLMKLAKKGANLDPKHHGLKLLLQAVVSGSKETKRARHIEDVIEGADGVKVYGDYECLTQAFTNIVDNALDAVKSGGAGGGIKITVAEVRAEAQVSIVFENPGGLPADPSKWMETAMKGELTKPDGRQCSGIYIASHLIKAQGGTFHIESDRVTWTRVHVTLPLAQTEED